MNSSEVTIEIAKSTDAKEIMLFIREHWSKNHILGSSKALLDWQYAAADHYNFVIGRSRNEGIVGLLGFIPISRYDATLTGSRDTIWLALWKVRDDFTGGLGLRLLFHLQKLHPQSLFGVVGINPAVRGIYAALGFKTGALTRFALVRSDCLEMALATLPDSWSPPKAVVGDTVFTELDGSNFLERTSGLGLDDSKSSPFKTCAYVHARYLQHPYYTYRAWLATGKQRNGVLISRMCMYAGASALRIVDFVGDPFVLVGAGAAFESLLHSSGAEYLDFFSTGLSSELASAGLFDAAQVPGLVLPGYFEPFSRRNVELLYALNIQGDQSVVCKGDGDQDRPNEFAASI